MLAGAADGSIYVVSMDGRVVRSRPREGSIGSLVVDTREDCVSFATYESPHNPEAEYAIYVTRNCGATWMGIDGMGSQSLPDVPVANLALDPVRDRIYASTPIGVFVSLDGGNTWFVEGELPAVATSAFEMTGEG